MTTRKLYHPLWAHLPALALIVVMIVAVWRALPLPARAPVHFDFAGRPNGYGSPLLVSIFVIALGVFYLVISALGDEQWARHEEAKRINWFSLLDEAIIGFLGGIMIAYLPAIKSAPPALPFPTATVLLMVLPATAAALALEALRPHVPHPHRVAPETEALEQSLAGRLRQGQPAVYWESQHPWWMNVIVVVLAAALIANSIATWGRVPALTIMLLAFALALPLLYGGLRVTVTREAVTVRLGVFGLRVARLRLADIAQVEVREFSPLADFGGWGLRYGRGGVRGYFLRGNVGVQLTTANGRKYLLGSDHPDRLASAVRAFIAATG